MDIHLLLHSMTSVPASPANNSHGIVVGDYVRFGTSDHIESYLVTAVNGGTGELTLNRGYRNISGAVIWIW